MRVKVSQGKKLLKELQQQNISLPAPCGGKGTCGKCKVRVVEAESMLPVTAVEQGLLTEAEQRDGIRLACCHSYCESDVTVEVTETSSPMDILGVEKECYDIKRKEDGVGIAVDLGTTTLVMAVIDLRDGRCLSETKVANPQRMYGADVLSRIQACGEHGVTVLQQMVLREVESVVRQVISTGQTIRRMVVCGNSTMEHIFLGISPECISVPPYECQVEEMQVVDSGALWEKIPYFPVVVLPNLAAFVGGDIVAGILAMELDQQDMTLLIDLGTNGEMALSHDGKIYTTSTAAGPAFEGGNMLCGMASVPGAICHIQMDGEDVEYQVIGQPVGNANTHGTSQNPSIGSSSHDISGIGPIGICGSGYMEGISELLIQGFVDETGYMEKEVEIEGDIRIVPADIRNFQLAKSAVRSGINILCQRAGLSFAELEAVYIAGGFGKNSNLAALTNLKIIPRKFVAKTRLVGNTALEGTIHVLLEGATERLSAVRERNVSVNLACEESFSQEYMKNMMF